jgi:NADH:ubiquinone oxidoreductase subunit 3 (subunit A)
MNYVGADPAFKAQYHHGGDDSGALFNVLGNLTQVILWLLTVLARGLGSHPRYPSLNRAPASSYECGFAPFATISSSSLVIFRQLAVYFVVFEAELVFLYP